MRYKCAVENAEKSSNERQDAPVDKDKLIGVITANWQQEKESEATYRTLADRETDAHRRVVLMMIAEEEYGHAERWAKRLHELGAPRPVYTGSPTGIADTFANRVGGTDATIRRAEISERREMVRLGRQVRELNDPATSKILIDLASESREHSRLLRALTRPERLQPHRMYDVLKPIDPAKALDDLRAKRGRRSPAGWIGDAIYGVNDGLGAIFGIVSGVSGATLGNSGVVLLAGLAGMIASALSMGSGAYLAAKSEREIYEAELMRKREQIAHEPKESLDEMRLIYQVKGVPEEDARRMAEHLYKDPEQFLRTLATEELNLSEEALSNPIASAVSGSVSTAIGAAIPIVPFFFMHGYPAVIAAAIVSLVAHFAVGAAKTLITVRSWWSSGLEMTVVGLVEGVVTYMIGVGLGHVHI
jgi:VIT1/CCC1 family predicted Fe2+/Mn2+ transporter/rubrerythrin